MRGNPKGGENGRLRRIRFAEPDPPTCRIGSLGICRLPVEILNLDNLAPLFLWFMLDRRGPHLGEPASDPLGQGNCVSLALRRRHVLELMCNRAADLDLAANQGCLSWLIWSGVA